MTKTYAQELQIITLDRSVVTTEILDDASKKSLLDEFDGRQDNSLRKKWTARTFLLSDGRLIVEFYDKQAVLIRNLEDFEKLREVRFVKNSIYFLIENISYNIELSFDIGQEIVNNQKPNRLSHLKSDMSEYYEFEVYELSTKQILFIDKSEDFQHSIIYPDLKTLSSDNTTIQEQVYGSYDYEYLMKRIAAGDRLPDYSIDHLIYPKYLGDLIKNHELTLKEQEVYVSSFHGNLYQSKNGYFILVDDIKQKNGTGRKKQILSLRIYDDISEVRAGQESYKNFKSRGVTSSHFYQEISDKYGPDFQEAIIPLIDSLPLLLNFDQVQLSLDNEGMDLVDEALKWNGVELFDSWFPAVLAYYGECYMKEKQDGKWDNYYDEEANVWVPEVRLKDGRSAWDWIDFYKALYEGPVPMRWVGGWDSP